jgi:tRNA dimethylallyltransferase
MNLRSPAIIIVVGPTASGKTSLAIKLAKKHCGEVISADSRQVYKGLDIGTGKVTKKEMSGVPHHLLDVTSPKKIFTAQDFLRQGRACIHDILARGKVPIIAGGTGFYIDALVGRISLPEVSANPALRKRLEKKTAATLFKLLQMKDPKRAHQMDTPSERNNKVRLVRALEVALSKKKSTKKEPLIIHDRTGLAGVKVEWIGIEMPLAKLEKRIRKRLDDRMKAGMLDEARKLHKGGLSYRRMEQLGLEYRYMARLLQNKITRKEFDEQLFREIRNYAKRQVTYWKWNEKIQWIKK